ncbi:cupin domain-containing protein [Rothia sp. HC945]|uniref:cupin domain-containing protein n=1 Tax=Rothia sp. HC945 TaxID=3171170 RepID=UPI003F212157
MNPFDIASQRPGSPTGTGVLDSLLTNCDQDTFAREVWGKRALLSKGASDFSDLFSGRAVDELISRRGLRSPFLRVAKDGSTLPTSSFTGPAGVGATITDQLDDTSLWRHFDDGATLVLQALQRTWGPVGDFSAQLSSELANPIQANAYITPPQNQGFDDHYDVHDVFVLQIEGTKRWVIHEPVLDSPLRDQPWTDRRDAVATAAAGEPYIDAVLEPGDALYLPRGWLHAATAQGEVSIHLTLGIHNRTRYAVAEQVVASVLANLRDDPQMRASLPLGIDDPDSADLDMVKEAILSAVPEADPYPELARVHRSQARPGPLGPLAQYELLKNLTEQTPLQLRDSLDARFEGSRLRTRVGWLEFSDDDLEHVRALVVDRITTAGDLGVDLAERLVRAGVLVPVAH